MYENIKQTNLEKRLSLALSKLSITSLKEGMGHDGEFGDDLHCNLNFLVNGRNKKILAYKYNATCGETDLTYVSDKQKSSLLDLIKEHDVKSVFLEMHPDLYKKIEDVNDVEAIDQLVNQLYKLKAEAKSLALFKKHSKIGILFGFSSDNYSRISWKGNPTLAELASTENGVLLIQKAYNRAKEQILLVKGKRILNDLEELKGLGIKL